MKHETYNRWSIGLHWLMLLLFVLAYASIELRGIFEKGTAQRELMKSAHFSMGLAILALPGGRAAVARHRGPYAELEAAYAWLYRDWLPASGQEPADHPCFELYLNDPRRTAPADLLTDVCLPLA